MFETLNSTGVNIKGLPGLAEQEEENRSNKDVCGCHCGFSSSGCPCNWDGESRPVMNMGHHCLWVTLGEHMPACGRKNGTTLERQRAIILPDLTLFEWVFQVWLSLKKQAMERLPRSYEYRCYPSQHEEAGGLLLASFWCPVALFFFLAILSQSFSWSLFQMRFPIVPVWIIV